MTDLMNSLLQGFLGILWFAGLVGFVALIIYRSTGIDEEQAGLKRDAILQFTQWQGSAAAAQLQLGAGQCEVVQESETVGRHRGGQIYSYTLMRFLRNSAGDYFLFMSMPDKPYIKPITPAAAKVVLKKRFVEPGHGLTRPLP